ncbi:putative isomerase, Enoyl-CoA hydratase, 3-hydroxyacyl-CoA dehydrogenase [Helianthus anomalus]
MLKFFVNTLVLLKTLLLFHVDLLFTAMATRLESKLRCASIHILSNTMEAARKPSVAAIVGVALGGGLEADYIICDRWLVKMTVLSLAAQETGCEW